MGACIILTPLVIASWPAITAAVTAAVSSMGFSMTQGSNAAQRIQTSSSCDIAIENSEILEGADAISQSIVVERDGIRATFSRDARGALSVRMEGETKSKSELRTIGQDLIGRVTQQYAYHRIVSEMKKQNMTVVDEQVTADRTVKIRVRSV